MCTPTAAGTMIPYGLKIPSPYFSFGPSNGGGGGGGGGVTQGQLAALDFQRSQLHDYNVRVQLGLRNYQNSLGLSPFHAYITDPYAHAYFYKHDPRARFVQEEPKPSHSYIGLIGMAILQSKEKKLVLSDIYQWILDNYPYFRTRGPGWRNSIRHNLSLNDCFIKSGRSANGKGHYWAVHPANVDDFERGDFRRRRAQRKVRRHMGLAVPDDDDSPSPSPTQPWMHHDVLGSGNAEKASSPSGKDHGDMVDVGSIRDVPGHHQEAMRLLLPQHHPPPHPHHHHPHPHLPTPAFGLAGLRVKKPSRKRLFDMASLLAPDEEDVVVDDESSPEKIQSLSSPQPTSEPGIRYGNVFTKHKREGSEGDEEGGERFSRSNPESENRIVGDRGSDCDRILYDEDDAFCDEEDDDEDNCEEIHVTSDDETPDRVNSDSKCLSDVDSDLAVENNSTSDKTGEENCNNSVKRRMVDEERSDNKIEQETERQSREQRGPPQQSTTSQPDNNRHSTTSLSDGNNSVHISEYQSSTRLLNNPALLKQSQNIAQSTTMRAIYELMSDKFRDKDSHVFNPSDRQATSVVHPLHVQTHLSNKDDTGATRSSDSVTSVSDEHFKIPRNSLLHENSAPKEDLLGSTRNTDHHPIQRQTLEHQIPSSLSESISNSLRNEHQHRSLQSSIGKEFPRENSFSAFEALGIRPNPSIFAANHIHPGMLRAMGPFSGPPSLLSQGSVLPRPGIPTTCLQMLQASTAAAVPVPSLTPMASHNTPSTVMENAKR